YGAVEDELCRAVTRGDADRSPPAGRALDRVACPDAAHCVVGPAGRAHPLLEAAASWRIDRLARSARAAVDGDERRALDGVERDADLAGRVDRPDGGGVDEAYLGERVARRPSAIVQTRLVVLEDAHPRRAALENRE